MLGEPRGTIDLGKRDLAPSSRCSYHFPLARVLAISRTCLMKSSATGLSLRFFRVMIPFGTRAIGSSTGRTFRSDRGVGNLNEEVGKIEIKRPVARRLNRTSGVGEITVMRGGSSPQARKLSAVS